MMAPKVLHVVVALLACTTIVAATSSCPFNPTAPSECPPETTQNTGKTELLCELSGCANGQTPAVGTFDGLVLDYVDGQYGWDISGGNLPGGPVYHLNKATCKVACEDNKDCGCAAWEPDFDSVTRKVQLTGKCYLKDKPACTSQCPSAVSSVVTTTQNGCDGSKHTSLLYPSKPKETVCVPSTSEVCLGEYKGDPQTHVKTASCDNGIATIQYTSPLLNGKCEKTRISWITLMVMESTGTSRKLKSATSGSICVKEDYVKAGEVIELAGVPCGAQVGVFAHDGSYPKIFKFLPAYVLPNGCTSASGKSECVVGFFTVKCPTTCEANKAY